MAFILPAPDFSASGIITDLARWKYPIAVLSCVGTLAQSPGPLALSNINTSAGFGSLSSLLASSLASSDAASPPDLISTMEHIRLFRG